jgi:integrase
VAKSKIGLTQKRVRSLMARGVAGKYFDRDGLSLIIDSPTSARWERRYQLAGRARTYGIGPAKAYNLSEARELNRQVSQLLAQGIDPIEHRRAAPKVTTFRAMAERYIADAAPGWKNTIYAEQWRRSLAQYVYPLIGAVDTNDIGRPEVLAVLEQRIDDGKFWEVYPAAADRIRNRMEMILDYATARDVRDPKANPAAWKLLRHVLPSKKKLAKVVHYINVPYAEVPMVMAELARRGGIAFQALMFVILTAARSAEVRGATWDEIDLDDKTWTVPASRMKGGKEHRVPLSTPAMELLQSLHTEAGSPHVFVGLLKAGLSPGAMQAVMRRIGRNETVHGFRSSFADFAHERTSFDYVAIEPSLAHAVGSGVERAYRRGDLFDKRRRLMEAWGRFVTSTPATVDNLSLFVQNRFRSR